MDPITNPFAPGAGSRPPTLAGRDEVLTSAEIAVRRARSGRHAKSMMLLGLRGAGKTVLLVRIGELAEALGCATALIEAPEKRRLAALLVPQLRRVLIRIGGGKARRHVDRSLKVLRNFASAFKVNWGGVEVGVLPQPGLGASGDLESDLTDVLVEFVEATRAADTAAAILMDEVQYLSGEDLSALLVAVHHANQRGLPLVFFGAGLPQLAGMAGDAKSYAERLLDFRPVGPLNRRGVAEAVRTPIESAGAAIDDDALQEIARRTEGYPYFVQEWGARSWDAAASSPVTLEDVRAAEAKVWPALDAGFFRVRFDRLTPRERDYVSAMASLGQSAQRSGDVAARLGVPVTSAGPIRANLIRKGMIWSPSHGIVAFTVPKFHEYLLRVNPG